MILLSLLAALFIVLTVIPAGWLFVAWPALSRRKHYRCLTNIAALERELGMNLPERRAAFVASTNYTQLQKPYLLGYGAQSAVTANVIEFKRELTRLALHGSADEEAV